MLILKQITADSKPRITNAFQKSENVRSWLKKNHRLLAIAGTILSVIHSDQYDVGMEILDHIRKHPEAVTSEPFYEEVLAGWGCPFSEMVISNHKVHLYRSETGRKDWLDMNLSLGSYAGGLVVMPDIDVQFEYEKGTAIAISTRILRHGILPVESGNRMSFKFALRSNLARWVGTKDLGWFSRPFA